MNGKFLKLPAGTQIAGLTHPAGPSILWSAIEFFGHNEIDSITHIGLVSGKMVRVPDPAEKIHEELIAHSNAPALAEYFFIGPGDDRPIAEYFDELIRYYERTAVIKSRGIRSSDFEFETRPGVNYPYPDPDRPID